MEDIKWYYFLNKDKYSLMNREYLNSNSCIICSETTHRKYTVFKSYFDFYKYSTEYLTIITPINKDVFFSHANIKSIVQNIK